MESQGFNIGATATGVSSEEILDIETKSNPRVTSNRNDGESEDHQFAKTASEVSAEEKVATESELDPDLTSLKQKNLETDQDFITASSEKDGINPNIIDGIIREVKDPDVSKIVSELSIPDENPQSVSNMEDIMTRAFSKAKERILELLLSSRLSSLLNNISLILPKGVIKYVGVKCRFELSSGFRRASSDRPEGCDVEIALLGVADCCSPEETEPRMKALYWAVRDTVDRAAARVFAASPLEEPLTKEIRRLIRSAACKLREEDGLKRANFVLNLFSNILLDMKLKQML